MRNGLQRVNKNSCQREKLRKDQKVTKNLRQKEGKIVFQLEPSQICAYISDVDIGAPKRRLENNLSNGRHERTRSPSLFNGTRTGERFH